MTLVPFPVPIPGFVLNCPGARELAVKRSTLDDGRPALMLCTGGEDVGYAEAHVPLDQLEEVIEGMRSTARGATPVALQPAEAFSVAERQFLTFALDLAFDRMVSDDGFTDEDHAALERFRRMTVEEP
ncbi:hypothetical protein ACFXD5_06765 [Streptomyces sp. NPDC059385]|uniref:hypothetical protein n=1 Tax=Streptomyces sp. NPDC059385 TaxID=3346817 RepID=UPI003673B6BE